MGGSATVDGGARILHALGVRFLNASGEELFPNPENLATLNEIDTSKLDKRIPGTEIIVMCDVQNKLLGDKGAARVFGPQKGATAEGLIILKNTLHSLQRSSIATRVKKWMTSMAVARQEERQQDCSRSSVPNW